MKSRMKSQEHFFKCYLHCAEPVGDVEDRKYFTSEDCAGKLITRQSIHGAIMRSCEKGWNEAKNDAGWPDVIAEEEL